MGAIAALLADRFRRRRRLGHLYALAGKARRIQIVVPSLNVSEFTPQGAQSVARVPTNIRVMPMAEGGAIAQLMSALHSIGKENIELVSQETYQNDADFTISIGGPSLNSASAGILRDGFPRFSIKYPEHIASYGTTTFSPEITSDGELREDYGFLACSRPRPDRYCIVVCGVWAAGTQMAVSALLAAERKSEITKRMIKRETFFAVVHGEVRGLVQEAVQTVEVRSVGA